MRKLLLKTVKQFELNANSITLLRVLRYSYN